MKINLFLLIVLVIGENVYDGENFCFDFAFYPAFECSG